MSTYDEVPYPTYALPQTHPRHLATIATLLGLAPPAANNCRILELGCGNGGNIIPMAYASPECECVGIDYSQKAIETGRQQIEALQLNNISLLQCSLDQLDESLGTFDYILCHGVYSWVSPNLQQAILHLFRQYLQPSGIGFVSYNTFPGWHQRGVIRKMMNHHVQRFPEDSPTQRIQRARQLLEFLVRAVPAQQSAYALSLRENLELLSNLPDAYLFHEYLEEYNEPTWFLEFCERLGEAGLRYLGDADFSTMLPTYGFQQEIRQELEDLAPNLLEREQYLDFLRNRMFRQTLVCHQEIRPRYDVRADRVASMFVASPLKQVDLQVDLTAGIEQEFRSPSDLTLITPHSHFKAALVLLQEAWPSTLPFSDLVVRATDLLSKVGINIDHETCSNSLAKSILTTYTALSRPLIELTTHPAPFGLQWSDKPFASELARLQAESTNLVSNLRHESVKLGEIERFLLGLLDGENSMEDLEEQLVRRCQPSEAESTVLVDLRKKYQEDHGEEWSKKATQEVLQSLARSALLIHSSIST